MSEPAPAGNHKRRLRVPLGAALGIGLAGMMALAVGTTLAVGFYNISQNTRELLRDKADAEVDLLAEAVANRLDPVVEQARAVAERIGSGAIDIEAQAEFEALLIGATAATPQVQRLGILRPDLKMRRLDRDRDLFVTEDLADDPLAAATLAAARTMDGPTWGAPLRPPGTSQTFVVLRTPLRQGGTLLGVLTHVVPIVELSRFISLRAGRYMTSFVLYGGDRVLAHPALINWLPQGGRAPLPRLGEIGDPVLAAIWDGEALPLNLVARSDRSQIVGRAIGGERHLIAYRTLEDYGPLSWIVGSHATFDVVDAQVDRVRYTLLTGAGLMLLAAAAGIVVARVLSRPVQRQSELAHLVYAKRLDDIAPLPRSRFIEFDDAAAAFNRMVRGMRDRRRVRGLLGRYVPEAVAEALMSSEGALEPQTAVATVLFVDLADFTSMTERLGPQHTVDVLNAWFSAAVEVVERRHGVVTQFQGDAILATFNVPVADPGHAAQAVAAAREILALTDGRDFAGERIACRIGINTGELVAGTVGAAGRLNYTVHGDAVNVASRLESLNREYGTRVLVAAETARQSGDAELCRVGEIAVRGHSDPVEVFSIPGDAGGCG